MSDRNRILIALDASSHSLAALEAAVEIAHQRGGELLGVFVEDANLLRLSTCSLAKEVGASAAESRDLNQPGLESIFRANAAHARQALELAAEHRRIPWEFQVIRGEVQQTIVELVKEAEVVALGAMGSQWTSSSGFGSTALGVLQHAKGGVFIARSGKSITFPVTVVSRRLEESLPMLETAFGMGHLCHHYLNVLYLPDDDPMHELELRQWLTQVSQEKAVLFRMYVLNPPSMMNLGGYLEAFRPGTLILPDLPWLKKKRFLHQLGKLDSPVYLMREL